MACRRIILISISSQKDLNYPTKGFFSVITFTLYFHFCRNHIFERNNFASVLSALSLPVRFQKLHCCLMSDVWCLMSNTALSDVRYRLDLSPVKRSLTSPQFLVPHTTPICSKQPYVKESRFATSTRKSIFCWKHVPELLFQKRLKIGGADEMNAMYGHWSWSRHT